MYRHLEIDLCKLSEMHARGLSDRAIGRVLRCSRGTVYNRRHSVGLESQWGSQTRRRTQVRIEGAKLDALWARLPLEAKRRLLLGNNGDRSESHSRPLVIPAKAGIPRAGSSGNPGRPPLPRG